ncbi:hypothetical protein [Burkholderia aenigmatica]|uniref:hypothetical protein n=1 Tax=Burkholderia aenigmatica TaxID=2015348 RepID=UPI0020C7418C|nr:hypothetical protein [Burkholderia aenigmatica]
MLNSLSVFSTRVKNSTFQGQPQAQRLHRIEGRPVVLHWASLREQFGQEYQGKDPDKDFKKKFLHALRAVLAVYPQARVKQVTGGVMLMASPPPIPFKGS